MIFDKISNSGLYNNISKPIAKALKIAAETDFEKLADGRYEVDGDTLYYMVQRYKTRPVYEKIEAHKSYIDLQFLVKGNEMIGYSSIENLSVHTPFNSSNDVVFFNVPQNMTSLKMSKGNFAIFWPTDGHMPGCQVNDSEDVTKIVFKIKV